MPDQLRVVLTMIVKDEQRVIERCLAAAAPLVDAYCIVDTGSSDATMSIAATTLDHLPGVIVERPWVDFATNRTEALALAATHGEYAFMLDADDVVEYAAGWTIDAFRAQLESADVFDVALRLPPLEYVRPQITSTGFPFRYRGVVHEFLDIPPGCRHGGTIEGFTVRCGSGESNRSLQGDKFDRDAEVLRAALATEIDEGLRCRYTFYLAQSLRDAGHAEAAEQAYRDRITIGGWVEERCVASTEIGHLMRRRGAPTAEVIDAYLRAYDTFPARAESLCYAAEAARLDGRMPTAFALAARGLDTPRPQTALFLDASVYEWRLAYEAAISAYYVGELEFGRSWSLALLDGTAIPAAERRAVSDNLRFYEPAGGEGASQWPTAGR